MTNTTLMLNMHHVYDILNVCIPSSRKNKVSKPPIKPCIIDLFAGCGGLSLGAARAGFDVALAVELDDQAAASHLTNFPKTKLIHGDINKYSGAKLLASVPAGKRQLLSGVVGGPPCQGFSNIGKGDVSDPRNNLFIKFFQLIKAISPTFFLAENVPGILNSKYTETRSQARSYVESSYICLDPILVKASDYGAATSRTRVFFIGYRKDSLCRLSIEDFSPKNMPFLINSTNVECALDGLSADLSNAENGMLSLTEDYRNGITAQPPFFYERTLGKIPSGVGDFKYLAQFHEGKVNGCYPTRHTPQVKKRFGHLEYGECDSISHARRLDPNGFCPTIRAGTGPDRGSFQALRPVHPTEPRVITPREAARLQGFPDWFCLPNTIWHSFRQIGNSVSPIIAEAILKIIYQNLTT